MKVELMVEPTVQWTMVGLKVEQMAVRMVEMMVGLRAG